MAAVTSKRWALNSQLLLAIKNNDVTRASELFDEGVDTDTRFAINSDKRPAICLCVENNDIDMVQLMLGLGASVNQTDSNGQTPLHITCEYGYFSIAKLLLENRADVHSKNKLGHNSLHLAAKRGKADLVALLIHYGAELNRVDKLGRTPLHHAALVNQSDALNILLEAGAEARIEDKYLNTALHFAVNSLGTSVEGIAALSKAYPWAALKSNEERKTPLHILVGADRRGEEEALKVMLAEMSYADMVSPPTSLSPRSEKGHTPLHLAVLERKGALVRHLLASGAEVDTRDQLGRTPLECAVRDVDYNIVALLLGAGASTRHLINEKGVLPHVRDNTIIDMLMKASVQPMRLSSLCRRVICRTWGFRFQRSLDEFPRMWRDFLSYEEL